MARGGGALRRWKSGEDKEAGRTRFARSGDENDLLQRPRESTTPEGKGEGLCYVSQAREGNRVYDLLKVRESCMYACVEAGVRLLHGVLQANECCCGVRTTHLLPPTHVGQGASC